jgi:hypothetical protein
MYLLMQPRHRTRFPREEGKRSKWKAVTEQEARTRTVCHPRDLSAEFRSAVSLVGAAAWCPTPMS